MEDTLYCFFSSLGVDMLCKLLNICITPGWFYYVATTWTFEPKPMLLAAVLLGCQVLFSV
jgi:hypothetical protein